MTARIRSSVSVARRCRHPPPITLESKYWPSVRARINGDVELCGLSVRVHWHDHYAWVCIDVREVLAGGRAYQLINAHISLGTISLEAIPESRVCRTAEAARLHCESNIAQVKFTLPFSKQGRLRWRSELEMYPGAPCCFDVLNDELGILVYTAAAAFSGFRQLKTPLALPWLPGRTLHLSIYGQVRLSPGPAPCSRLRRRGRSCPALRSKLHHGYVQAPLAVAVTGTIAALGMTTVPGGPPPGAVPALGEEEDPWMATRRAVQQARAAAADRAIAMAAAAWRSSHTTAQASSIAPIVAATDDADQAPSNTSPQDGDDEEHSWVADQQFYLRAAHQESGQAMVSHGKGEGREDQGQHRERGKGRGGRQHSRRPAGDDPPQSPA